MPSACDQNESAATRDAARPAAARGEPTAGLACAGAATAKSASVPTPFGMSLTRYVTNRHENAVVTRPRPRRKSPAAASITERSEPYAMVVGCRDALPNVSQWAGFKGSDQGVTTWGQNNCSDPRFLRVG